MKLIAFYAHSTAVKDQNFIELANDADPRTLNLQGLDRIDLTFPKFTDGRAFSQAFLLRRRLGFKGEIRATGDVLVGEVPPYSVVVPGTLPGKDGGPALYCAVIVKRVDERTRSKTSINELLRD